MQGDKSFKSTLLAKTKVTKCYPPDKAYIGEVCPKVPTTGGGCSCLGFLG